MAGVAYIQQQQQPQMFGRTEQLGSVGQFNQPQVTPFWCQARFDYHSQDPSLLSFSRGDIIEVHTQLTTGWWDGVLNNERGWFPSNYVVQLSDQEVESLLYQLENERPARESDWGSNTDYHDSVGDSTVTGNSSQDFWVPEVTNDGQIFYVHSVTGEVSRELPADVDSEAPSDLYSFTDPGTSFTTRSRSNSRATDTTAADGRNGAGLRGRRLSITPDPWVKQQTADGLAFFYVNPQTGETSWAPPSPTLEDKIRQRSYSDATYNSNRESVVSDSSDIHPFMSSMPGASATEPDDLDGTQNTPAELSALQLQEALSTSSKHNFNQLISETRAATATIWEPALVVDDLSGRVDTTVATIRKLLYRAGTLPASGKMQEILAERDEPGQSRVKITQRKLVTTLSKVVLEARAITLNPANGLGRVQPYASDLDECIINFAQEIERRNLAEVANSRLAGLVSAEGAAGVGIGLVGAGLGGGWKGFGYVPTAENAPQRVLSSSLITDFQDQEAILREKAEGLSTSYSGPSNSSSEIRQASRDFLSRLLIFVNALADTNVAQHVDVDSMPPNLKSIKDNPYTRTVNRARVLIRRLEALTQSLYDHGGVFLLHAQDLPHNASNKIMPFMEQVGESVLVLEQLYEIGQEQSSMLNAREQGFDYVGSINRRMSRVISGPIADILAEQVDQEVVLDPALQDEDDEMVGLEDALSPNTRVPNSATSNTAVRYMQLSKSDDGDEYPYPEEPMPAPPIRDAPLPPTPDLQAEDLDEELGVVGASNPQAKAKTNKSKLERIFGRELPYQVAVADEGERPWYLKPDYPPQDLVFTNNHDDTIRAGTLPALIEHLTDHYRRDQNFIRTFLCTFKSFSTVNEVFDLLVARFNTPTPAGLTEEEEKDWKKSKQAPLQVRVINIMKQLILDDELLDPEEKGAAVLKIKEFALSVQEDVAAAKLLVRAADRSLDGEGAVILKPTTSLTNASPLPILPRSSRPKLKLMDIDSTEMARQLTLLESTLYKQIRAIDCLNRSKEQKGKSSAADHISTIIDHTNKVTMWINQQILEREDSRKRAAVIKYFISVAERCDVLQNYSTMAAMVSGLNTPPIRRLKRTWQQVGARAMASLESCERLFDSNKNFSNYRQVLAKVQAPCVPFLGMYLTTLIYIHEGSKDILPPPEAPRSGNDQPLPAPTGLLINFAKRQKAAETIREIKSWQSKPYNLTPVSTLHTFIEESLSQCNKVDEMSEQFWTRSLELEPRERDDERMARLLQESGFL